MEKNSNKKVKIYSTPLCSYCMKVKLFLHKHNIDYDEYDVSKNIELAEEMIKISGQTGVPVLDIEGKIIIGYNKDEIKMALGL
ncbi:MAG: glutathione S-transferase N-terminal domain-containing protein [Armatimonadetes bacterium]|nr:glutathione S-transferase N-terminal domain-containing protein [Armatimonadota bacterium]